MAIWSEIKTRNTKWYGRDAGVQFLKFYFRPKFDCNKFNFHFIIVQVNISVHRI
jgi:hypothetical protein